MKMDEVVNVTRTKVRGMRLITIGNRTPSPVRLLVSDKRGTLQLETPHMQVHRLGYTPSSQDCPQVDESLMAALAIAELKHTLEVLSYQLKQENKARLAHWPLPAKEEECG